MSDNVVPFPPPWRAALHSVDVCRCGHFRFKHSPNCFGVEFDDHSVRCGCAVFDLDPTQDDDDE